MSIINKLSKEEQVGFIFTNRYNRNFETNYLGKLNDEQDNDADYLIKTEAGETRIELQITTYDSKTLETLAKNHDKSCVLNPDRVNCIKNAINKKSTKNNGEKENLFLLIRSDGLVGINESYIKEETISECNNSTYKEIYILRTENGDIIRLK